MDELKPRTQTELFPGEQVGLAETSPRGQLLKWVGNKQRFARDIIGMFPPRYGRYLEPFVGGGAVLAAVAPKQGLASDVCGPLIEIWRALIETPVALTSWYAERWELAESIGKVEAYERVKAAYNAAPNGRDLVFLCRACYAGIVRFRKADGYMSTPCGIHSPIHPRAFAARVEDWHRRLRETEFREEDFRVAMRRARPGDLVYCDPPYTNTQRILYGAQSFSLPSLMEAIADCKRRGVYVALSINGTKRSGTVECNPEMPAGLFEREIPVRCGGSMIKRFQMNGQTLDGEVVADRLLLTY